MTTDDLDKKHCVPCEGGVEPLDMAAAKQISQAIDPAWNISDARSQTHCSRSLALFSYAFRQMYSKELSFFDVYM